jgi:hypothetical protein
MAAEIMSLALCRFSKQAEAAVNTAQKENARPPACLS